MSTRMTAQRLALLIADGDVDAVRSAVETAPHLLTATLERDGQGGWTPLHLAVADGPPDVVRTLVAAGADLGARTERDRTPLHTAMEFAPALVPLLRELGAPVDAPSAAYLDDVAQLTSDLDGGAPLVDPVSGVDLLVWAAHGGAADTVRLLLDRGADPDGGALQAAAAIGSAESVRLLLTAGADPRRRDPETGRTALHSAVDTPNVGDTPGVVQALLDAGVEVEATTSDGASALDILRVSAARSRPDDAGQATASDALADLLVSHGASG